MFSKFFKFIFGKKDSKNKSKKEQVAVKIDEITDLPEDVDLEHLFKFDGPNGDFFIARVTGGGPDQIYGMFYMDKYTKFFYFASQVFNGGVGSLITIHKLSTELHASVRPSFSFNDIEIVKSNLTWYFSNRVFNRPDWIIHQDSLPVEIVFNF